MKYAKLLSLGLFVATVTLAGCSNGNDPKADGKAAKEGKAEKAAAEHAHGTGPNGGVVFDMGGHHAEFTVDHGKQECTVLILGSDEKSPKAVDSTEFVLNIKATKTKEGKVVAPMTVTLKPADAKDGKASKFVGVDPGIGNVADFAGTVSGEIEGKPAQGEFKE